MARRNVVMVVVRPGGRVIGLRKMDGGVVLPGGKIEWRETPIRAAERELREETGARAIFAPTPILTTDATSVMLGRFVGPDLPLAEMRSRWPEGVPAWVSRAELESDPRRGPFAALIFRTLAERRNVA